MALEHVGKCIAVHTEEEYRKKKREVFSSIDDETEKLVGDMIYCRRCYEPKVYDDPAHKFVTKCCCKCEVHAFERRRTPPRNFIGVKRVFTGDYNPFDGAGR